MRLRLHTLRGKLSTGLVVLSVAVAAALLAGLVRGAKSYGEEVHHHLNRDVAQHIAKFVDPFTGAEPNKDALKALFMDVMVVNPALEVYLLDSTGQILAYDAPPERVVRERVDLRPVRRFVEGSGQDLVRGDDPRQARGRKPISAHPVEEDGRLRGYVYVVLAGEPYDSARALFATSWALRTGSLLVTGCLAASLLAGLLAIASLTAPLRRLREAMPAVSSEVQPRELPVEGDDEIAALTASFNSMSHRIRAQVATLANRDEERRRFIASISHDLRTPVAAIRGYVETLIERSARMDPDERQRHLTRCLRQCDRLGLLVTELFELARLEAREAEPHMEEFPLEELAQDIAAKFERPASERGVQVRAVIGAADLPTVRGDLGLIERALDNLLRNAIEHGGPGTRVELRLDPTPSGVGVTVRDNGAGIEDTQRIFEPFYREDLPADDFRAGAGLGLTITQRIVTLHGSRVLVDSSPGRGASFRFELLRAQADEREQADQGRGATPAERGLEYHYPN